MNTCESHNDAIVVYEGRKCPVCETISELEDKCDDYKRKYSDEEDKVSGLESEKQELVEQVASLEAELKESPLRAAVNAARSALLR